MKAFKLVVLIVVGASSVLVEPVLAQRYRGSRRLNASTHLETRLLALEQRVLALETLLAIKSSLLPSSGMEPQLEKSIEQWEQHVAAAESRLKHSERMASKGYITQFELFNDQLSVLWSSRELALAKGDDSAGKTKLLEMDVLQAKREVASASADLKLTQAHLRYGVSSAHNASSINDFKELVKEASQRLQQAEAALKVHLAEGNP